MSYGTLASDVIQSSTTGTPPQFNDGSGTQIGTLCRAWVNFNGANGTIRASYNVSSVTRTSTGYYTVTFANALTDGNYAPISWSSGTGSASPMYTGPFGNYVSSNTITAPATTGFTLSAFNSTGGSNYDPAYILIAIFR